MVKTDAYLFGQILMTTSLLLKEGMPPRDGYGELQARYRLIGGETAVCAAVLDSLGCTVRMQGSWLGKNTRDGVLGYFEGRNVDVSLLTVDDSFDGVEDVVLVDGDARTCFGMFGALQGPEGYRWDTPTAGDLRGCRVAAVDPYFRGASENTARLCVEMGIPYVTLDCDADNYIARHAAVNALSGEFLRDRYPGAERETLFATYAQQAEGLTIFTAGSRELLYGRRGGPVHRARPYRVKVESTLGAGDTFKAGCTYALLKEMDDAATVDFASACAASAIMRFPIPLNLPTLEGVAAVRAARA